MLKENNKMIWTDVHDTLKSSVSSVETKKSRSMLGCNDGAAPHAKFCILKSANYKNDGIVW